MAELADALDLGSSARKGVGVQVSPSAPAILQSRFLGGARGLLLLFSENVFDQDRDIWPGGKGLFRYCQLIVAVIFDAKL